MVIDGVMGMAGQRHWDRVKMVGGKGGGIICDADGDGDGDGDGERNRDGDGDANANANGDGDGDGDGDWTLRELLGDDDE